MNIQKIRKDFPILKTKINGNDLIYLDNAATSQKPKAVIDSLIDYYEKYNSNVHRGVHTLSVKATDEYEKSRTKVREFINADRDEEIIYTRNASESLNLIAYSWGSKNIKSGDDIFITPFEHHSNIVPWQELCKEKKANLKYIPLNESGDVDLDKLKSMVGNKTKLISVTHMSNVLGTLLPVKEIIEISKNTPAITVIDACQSVPHMPVDVKDLDCDFLCFSGHKMLGPTGIGVLYGKFDILDKSVDEILADKEIDIILNLTNPTAHYEVIKKTLIAEKHSYCEKPLSINFAQGKELIDLAQSKNLYLGNAPDTFLGGGGQLTKKLIDDCEVGEIKLGNFIFAFPN